MEYKYEYICKMKEPVVCELCNESYAIGRMKAHKQKRMLKNVEYHPHGGLWVVQNQMLLLDSIINNSHNQTFNPPIHPFLKPIPPPIPPPTHPPIRWFH